MRRSCLVSTCLCLPLLLACGSDDAPAQTGESSSIGDGDSSGDGDGDGETSGDGDGDTSGDGDGDGDTSGDGDGDGDTSGDGDGDEGGIKFDLAVPPDSDEDCGSCSGDYQAVLGCGGVVTEECVNGTACDPGLLTCLPACDVAETHKFSVGCEYFPIRLESYAGDGYCYAAFVSNPWNVPAHIDVEFGGMPLAVETFAFHPEGAGPNLAYSPYDPDLGIAPGEMVILFLSGSTGAAPLCPQQTAVPAGAELTGTGFGTAFRIQSDVPVVAYQMNPYGGGSVAVTGASLLIPSSAWDLSYIGANAYEYDLASPTLNVVAAHDQTELTIWPVNPIQGGNGLPPGPANQPYVFNLDAGEHAQFSQTLELTGSVLVSDKPVGVLAGHACLRVPLDVAFCDHAEEMIPPVGALGSQYAGVMHRPRKSEPSIWRIIGAVDDTALTWSVDVGGPPTLQAGQVAEFTTGEAFMVAAQDEDHPFMLMNYMSGSTWSQVGGSGYGDPEFAISVPVDQYLRRYVFFTDPTYPETSINVVRRREAGIFHEVELDCLGVIDGWQAIDPDTEYARVQLVTGDFQQVGNCTTGSHEIHSDGPFGLWVWGWGTPETSSFTSNVSYGYPGGMNVATINDVSIIPEG